MEDQAARYSVTLPKGPAAYLKIDKKIDELIDKFVYRKIFEDLVTEMFALARAYRTSTTNDSIRDLFKKHGDVTKL